MTRMLHPPGGATALIAVIGSTEIHKLGVSLRDFPSHHRTTDTVAGCPGGE